MREVSFRTFVLVGLTLAGSVACGDPCLDDGFGKGECTNQTGADEASTTDASASGTAEGTADGNSESASGTAEGTATETATATTTDTATTDATDTATTDATGETGVDACADEMVGEGETDVDCGGVCVIDPLDPANPEGKCDDGEGCLIDSDCVSNVCDPDSLVCVGECSNGMQDPNETDIDCGDDCVIVNPMDMNDVEGQCNQGEGCNDPMDCVAGDCIDNACDVCALQDDYTVCQTCLVTNCCPDVQDCLANIDKCVCWFNCIGTMGATVQGCMDSCGNGNIGTINSCINSQCKGNNECQ